MEKIIYINSENEMILLGEHIGKKLNKNDVVTLIGDLGAGKTTLTKGIGKALDVKSIINSPTFTILKIHEGRIPLYHMDVYRIDKDSKDDDLEEFFEMNGVVVIEWAKNIEYLLPDELLEIKIETKPNNKRKVIITSFGNRYDNILKGIEL